MRADSETQYLIYKKPSFVQRTGFGHMTANLKILIGEAAWLGRVPVFPDCIECLSTAHNLGYPVNSSWDTYLDIENIQVTFNLDAGTRRLTLSAITETEFNALNIPATDILEPGNDHAVTDEENSRYRAVIRYVPKDRLWREQILQQFNPDSFAHGPATPADAANPAKAVQPTLSPSHTVREMMNNAIKKLPGDYYGIHIRRGDCLQFPGFIEATNPRFILQKLDEFGIKPGATLFVMTDEILKRYLNPLKKKYRIVRYTDFPELKSLVTRPEPIDNHLLFTVESEIVKHAKKKIYTFKTATNVKQTEVFFLINATRFDMMTLDITLGSEIAFHKIMIQKLLEKHRLNMGSAKRKKLIRDLLEELHILGMNIIKWILFRIFLPGRIKRHTIP